MHKPTESMYEERREEVPREVSGDGEGGEQGFKDCRILTDTYTTETREEITRVSATKTRNTERRKDEEDSPTQPLKLPNSK